MRYHQHRILIRDSELSASGSFGQSALYEPSDQVCRKLMFRFPGIIFGTKAFQTYTIQPGMALLITSHIHDAIDDIFVIPVLSSVVSTGDSGYLRRAVRRRIRDCVFGVADLQNTIHVLEDYVRLRSWWREFARANFSSQNYAVAGSELNIVTPSASLSVSLIASTSDFNAMFGTGQYPVERHPETDFCICCGAGTGVVRGGRMAVPMPVLVIDLVSDSVPSSEGGTMPSCVTYSSSLPDLVRSESELFLDDTANGWWSREN
jgi:hypothetical protein